MWNYLVFQPILRHFEKNANSNRILGSKSKRFSDKSINRLAASKIQEKFDSCCLKQDKVTFTHKQAVNI